MCLQDVSRAKLAALLPETVAAPSVPALKDEADRKPEYPKPDTNQMIPFQPRHLARMYCCTLNFSSSFYSQVRCCSLFCISLKHERIYLLVFLPTAPGLHPVPGGVFPVPPAAVVLMKLLPPPTCFTVSSSSSLTLSSSYLLVINTR